MSQLLVTPILIHYNFLDELCREAASSLALDLNNEHKYQQFKTAIFLNFNRYLVDSLLFLPASEAENLLARLTPAMETANEAETLNILQQDEDFLSDVRSDFLNIIKSLKK